MSSYDPDPTGLSDGEQGNQIPCIDPEETRMWEEIIRSPEAEAYWRERIAFEFDAESDRLDGIGLEHHADMNKYAAAFVRGKTQEG